MRVQALVRRRPPYSGPSAVGHVPGPATFMSTIPTAATAIRLGSRPGGPMEVARCGPSPGPWRWPSTAIRSTWQTRGNPDRESLTLSGSRHSGSSRKAPFVLAGNGAVLDGTAPVPVPTLGELSQGGLPFRAAAGRIPAVVSRRPACPARGRQRRRRASPRRSIRSSGASTAATSTLPSSRSVCPPAIRSVTPPSPRGSASWPFAT